MGLLNPGNNEHHLEFLYWGLHPLQLYPLPRNAESFPNDFQLSCFKNKDYASRNMGLLPTCSKSEPKFLILEREIKFTSSYYNLNVAIPYNFFGHKLYFSAANHFKTNYRHHCLEFQVWDNSQGRRTEGSGKPDFKYLPFQRKIRKFSTNGSFLKMCRTQIMPSTMGN